ncbi:hypothetical protein ACFORL_07755 [Legionella dresdenensis]|uniref:Cadherin domain-containing protein n=1 Tax=Legionella dresdenensis TaxID=450200 RepID=A0ABV8CFM9_9GAMM
MNGLLNNLIGACLILSAAVSYAANDDLECTEQDKPSIAKTLDDYTIMAGNSAKISTAEAFNGTNFVFSVSAKVTNPANQVMINRRNGIIVIKAEHKDDFDVVITATNPCGSASAKFNVEIDEEE